MSLSWPFKDPNEVLDYVINWAARLGADTILTSTWTPDAGITQQSSSNTTTTTTIWLSGGTEGSNHSILNRITTTSGRTMDQTVKLKIKSK